MGGFNAAGSGGDAAGELVQDRDETLPTLTAFTALRCKLSHTNI